MKEFQVKITQKCCTLSSSKRDFRSITECFFSSSKSNLLRWLKLSYKDASFKIREVHW